MLETWNIFPAGVEYQCSFCVLGLNNAKKQGIKSNEHSVNCTSLTNVWDNQLREVRFTLFLISYIQAYG